MGKKMKEYFKGKNPYYMVSAAIVIVSMMIICMILKGEMSASKENVEVSEVIVTEIEESGTLELLVQESEISSEVSDFEPENMVEMQTLQTEPVHSMSEAKSPSVPEETISGIAPAPETEIVAKQEPNQETEKEVAQEVVPEMQPENMVQQEPEEEATDETVAEAESQPEVIPQPEETPFPEVIPEPEEIPEPPHEHSWIFESYFQEPTCSNGGLENQICARCGETRTVGGTPTGKHDFVVEAEGDCSSEEIVRCNECNAREMRGYNMTNHIDVEDGICYGCGQKVTE